MSETAPDFPPPPYTVQEVSTTQARKDLAELVNQAVYGHVHTILTRDGRRLARIIPEEDAWFYTPGWQEKLAKAKDDVAEGRTRTFESMDDMFADLETER
ncbi:type II toxin-antitoxin system Phd/YefM family antitoxin [Microbispora sp. ATCC PTA-5024]|uniref:type II toxin-antitoxin system Phd/YefM family antitoxin n=1 Tax=Microbispora sp. ATCC PTA-5024 TaxID=316330 RepID=UPI000A003970|nr:type II toxin-antitoxin system Phd/YefM family antitoxin [Microbispora sp. ATCC PTA-5024]